MKLSKVRRTAALAFALAALMASCSKFAAQSDVDIKRVPIDLAFGKAPPTAENVSQPQALPPAVLELPPPVIPDFNFDDTPVDLCPPVKAVGARDISPTSIEGERTHAPKQGDYLYRFVWNYANKEQKSRDDLKTIGVSSIENNQYNYSNRAPQQVREPAGNAIRTVPKETRDQLPVDPDTEWPSGFAYTIAYGAPPGITLSLESHPENISDPANNGTTPPDRDFDGLYFKGIQIPVAEGKPETLAFQGLQQTMKLLDYPIQPGTSISRSGPDTAVKSDQQQIPNPVTGGFLETPARGTLTSTTWVGEREIIDVCEELAQAWKVNWKLVIAQADYDITMVGTWWISTAYGGLPVREDWTISGTLINGNFFSQMMRLDPGAYL